MPRVSEDIDAFLTAANRQSAKAALGIGDGVSIIVIDEDLGGAPLLVEPSVLGTDILIVCNFEQTNSTVNLVFGPGADPNHSWDGVRVTCVSGPFSVIAWGVKLNDTPIFGSSALSIEYLIYQGDTDLGVLFCERVDNYFDATA